ncbi:hypothetical protein D9M68_857100 [compost metagenome]
MRQATLSSTSFALRSATGSRPMKGKTSLVSQVSIFSWVLGPRLLAVFTSQSRATTSNVFPAAAIWAAFSSRLATFGLMPSASCSRAFSRRWRALARETSG